MKRTQLSCLLHNDDKRQRKDEHCAPWHSNMEEIVLINLPYEILEQIIAYLGIIRVGLLQFVCKDLCILLHDNLIWRSVFKNRFVSAVFNSNLKSWKKLVVQAKREKECDSSKEGVFFWAINNGYTSLVSRWIPRMNIPPVFSNSIVVGVRLGHALDLAALNGHRDILSLLLRFHNVVPKSKIDNLLIVVCKVGHVKCCELLIDHKADLDCILNGNKPVHVASMNGHTKIVTLLLENRAAIDSTNENNSTSLFIAARDGHYECVKTLVSKGADMEIPYRDGFGCGFTALFMACENGHGEIVDYLLSHGANLEKVSEDSSRPVLYVASQNGHYEIVASLLKYKANTEHEFHGKYTAIYVAAQNGHHLVIRELLKARANVNFTIPNSGTSLYIASQNGHIECIKDLLLYGAETQAIYSYGYTPLYIACQKGHYDVVAFLVNWGLDIDTKTDRNATPLYNAAEKGFLKIVTFLLENKASVNHTFINGFTPLHIACYRGHFDIVKILVTYGANIEAKSLKGKTALQIANKNNNTDICKFLCQ